MADPPDADSMSERRFGASESLEPSPSGRTISVGADDSLPELLRFHQLQHWMASDEDLPWGESWLATQFDGARDLFNEAIRRLNRAMGYYVLDGHVTEHFTIKMDVSNLYRLLAVFEEDPKRIVAMHKRRIKALEDVIRDLSQVHFPGELWSS